MKLLLTALLSMTLACAAHSQSPQAAAPTPAAGTKVAMTSLIGDALNITSRRERTGTNMGNTTTAMKMPGPLLDLAVLKAAQEALEKALPSATIAALKVPAAGSSTDPAQVYADGKVVAGNVLVDALRQQGFTHLLTVTKQRSTNNVRTSDGVLFGSGLLEGIGFYIDPTATVQRHGTSEIVQGIIAPYLYVEMRLVDLSALEVRAVQTIAASSTIAAANNPSGTDAWGALTAEEKMTALQRLIRRNVSEAAPLLFQSK
jgi:hypothetical protein